jgi:23S rRNA (uracil1939-C5)-methyltransferase
MQRHSIVLRLDSMTYGGDALGRAGGKAIFVPGGIAGELVRAEIVEERGRFARARLVEVIEPAPERVQPRCPHFGECGGCAWQHIDYGAQLRFKAEIVREQLRRIGKIKSAPVRDMLPSPDVWAYRNHAQFSASPDGRLGFQAAHSNRVIPIEICHLFQPPIMEWFKSAGRMEAGVERVDVRCAGSRSSATVERSGRRIQSGSPLEFTVKGVPLRVSAESFFQVNTLLIETLVDLVTSGLGLRGGDTALDAYSGVGLFSRFLAPVAGRVIGIESSRSAMADARANLAQFDHVEWHEGWVEQTLPSLALPIHVAVLDPPRAGCGPQVIQALIDKQIERLVYVSCDPATLARDARQLMDAGYVLAEVQPVDLFPHTFHIETVTAWKMARPALACG